MPRKVDILVFRHSIKKGDALTPEGEKLAFETGIKIGKKSRAPTTIFSSPRNRTQQTSKKLQEGIRSRGGTVEEKVVLLPEFSYHSDYEPEPGAIMRFSSKMGETAAKQSGLAFLNQWHEGKLGKDAIPMEEVGAKMADFFAEPYHKAQENGKPLRYIFVTHADSNVESIFYALTGIHTPEVKGKGGVPFMNGFRMSIDGKKMRVEFHGRKFPVQDFWKGILRKRNPTERVTRIQRNVLEMIRQRKSRVKRKLRDPKRRTWRG